MAFDAYWSLHIKVSAWHRLLRRQFSLRVGLLHRRPALQPRPGEPKSTHRRGRRLRGASEPPADIRTSAGLRPARQFGRIIEHSGPRCHSARCLINTEASRHNLMEHHKYILSCCTTLNATKNFAFKNNLPQWSTGLETCSHIRHSTRSEQLAIRDWSRGCAEQARNIRTSWTPPAALASSAHGRGGPRRAG